MGFLTNCMDAILVMQMNGIVCLIGVLLFRMRTLKQILKETQLDTIPHVSFTPVGETPPTRPKRATVGSAGFDIYPAVDLIIPPHTSATINTGYAFNIPKDHVGLIAARSSMHLCGVTVTGVIDSDYKGEVMVMLRTGAESYMVSRTRAVAQLLVVRYVAQSAHGEDAPTAIRGKGAFGSTG
ncbi:dUTPase [Salmonid herpesvirus 1]|uniref:dUTP diphosphatase n=1 Tax=Salmonid herpesvirus 1 TaxID=67604 RepID=O38018_9VIRU|nr:dUTPase [Salmonid herpesvirus 1]AAC59317.1 dUTPase [Salmonid herpesvirus 1]UNP64368.1 dUTPase [Salmonid herpesvirus 1]